MSIIQYDNKIAKLCSIQRQYFYYTNFFIVQELPEADEDDDDNDDYCQDNCHDEPPEPSRTSIRYGFRL